MPWFRVRTKEVWTQEYDIEAETEEEAKIFVSSGNIDSVILLEDMFEFSHWLDKSLWDVEVLSNA